METSTKLIMKKTNNRQKSPKNSPSAYYSLILPVQAQSQRYSRRSVVNSLAVSRGKILKETVLKGIIFPLIKIKEEQTQMTSLSPFFTN